MPRYAGTAFSDISQIVLIGPFMNQRVRDKDDAPLVQQRRDACGSGFGLELSKGVVFTKQGVPVDQKKTLKYQGFKVMDFDSRTKNLIDQLQLV